MYPELGIASVTLEGVGAGLGVGIGVAVMATDGVAEPPPEQPDIDAMKIADKSIDDLQFMVSSAHGETTT